MDLPTTLSLEKASRSSLIKNQFQNNTKSRLSMKKINIVSDKNIEEIQSNVLTEKSPSNLYSINKINIDKNQSSLLPIINKTTSSNPIPQYPQNTLSNISYSNIKRISTLKNFSEEQVSGGIHSNDLNAINYNIAKKKNLKKQSYFNCLIPSKKITQGNINHNTPLTTINKIPEELFISPTIKNSHSYNSFSPLFNFNQNNKQIIGLNKGFTYNQKSRNNNLVNDKSTVFQAYKNQLIRGNNTGGNFHENVPTDFSNNIGGNSNYYNNFQTNADNFNGDSLGAHTFDSNNIPFNKRLLSSKNGVKQLENQLLSKKPTTQHIYNFINIPLSSKSKNALPRYPTIADDKEIFYNNILNKYKNENSKFYEKQYFAKLKNRNQEKKLKFLQDKQNLMNKNIPKMKTNSSLKLVNNNKSKHTLDSLESLVNKNEKKVANNIIEEKEELKKNHYNNVNNVFYGLLQKVNQKLNDDDDDDQEGYANKNKLMEKQTINSISASNQIINNKNLDNQDPIKRKSIFSKILSKKKTIDENKNNFLNQLTQLDKKDDIESKLNYPIFNFRTTTSAKKNILS